MTSYTHFKNGITRRRRAKNELREEGSNLCLRGDQIAELEFKSGALDHSAITDILIDGENLISDEYIHPRLPARQLACQRPVLQ